MNTPILTVIHCDRCNHNMLIQFPPDDPTDHELDVLAAVHREEAWAIAQLDQLRARLLTDHQTGCGSGRPPRRVER